MGATEDELAAKYLHHSHATLLKLLLMRDRKIAIYESEIVTLKTELQRANESLQNELQRMGERETPLKTELRHLEEMISNDCVFRDKLAVEEEEPPRPLSPKEIMQSHVDRVSARWGEVSLVLHKAASSQVRKQEGSGALQQALDKLRHSNVERRQRLEQVHFAQQAGREARQMEVQRGGDDDDAPQLPLPSSPSPKLALPGQEATRWKQSGQAPAEGNQVAGEAIAVEVQDSCEEGRQSGEDEMFPPLPPPPPVSL